MAVELGRAESEVIILILWESNEAPPSPPHACSFQLSEVCSHVLASFQVPRAEHSMASPHQAIQVVTQFSNHYTKIEEKLALCEQELEQVMSDSNICENLLITLLQVKESKEAVNDGILDLCKSLKESQDGMSSDLIGALRRLSESLQKICSESENFNKLIVSV